MADTVAASLARIGRRALAIGAVVLGPGGLCPLQAAPLPAPTGALVAASTPLKLSLAKALEVGLAGSLELRQAAVLVDQADAAVAFSQSRFWPKLDLVGLATSLQRSLQNRPSLRALIEQHQAALAQVQVARAARLPTLGVSLGAGYSGDILNLPVLNASGSAAQGAGSAALPGLSATGSSSGSFYDWGVVLSLRQSLIDGGAANSAIAGAQQQTRLSAIALEQARQAIVLSVQTWWAQHQAAQVQIEAGRAAVRAAELASRDAQLRYRSAIAPILEVLIAQRDLQAARSSLAVAIQRLNLSRAGLQADTGDWAGVAGALSVGTTGGASSALSLGHPAISP